MIYFVKIYKITVFFDEDILCAIIFGSHETNKLSLYYPVENQI